MKRRSATGRQVAALPCKVAVGDLSSCCDEYLAGEYLATTHPYRSFEGILRLDWRYSTDMWSMGCIIYELSTGRRLFDVHDDLEHLHLIEKRLGRRVPERLGEYYYKQTGIVFQPDGVLQPLSDARVLKRVKRARPICESIADAQLCDLILSLLKYSPYDRLTARAMTTHPYVMQHYPECVASKIHPKNRGALPPVPAY